MVIAMWLVVFLASILIQKIQELTVFSIFSNNFELSMLETPRQSDQVPDRLLVDAHAIFALAGTVL